MIQPESPKPKIFDRRAERREKQSKKNNEMEEGLLEIENAQKEFVKEIKLITDLCISGEFKKVDHLIGDFIKSGAYDNPLFSVFLLNQTLLYKEDLQARAPFFECFENYLRRIGEKIKFQGNLAQGIGKETEFIDNEGIKRAMPTKKQYDDILEALPLFK